MKKMPVLLIFCAGLAGCAEPEIATIYLQKAENQKVSCPGHKPTAMENVNDLQRIDQIQRECVNDFQKAGYQRTAAPQK